jgi:hypothetical protein
MMTPGSAAADLPPLLRRRLLLVASLVTLATAFFAVFRASQPIERAFFLGTSWGVAFLVFEAAVGLACLGLATALWRAPRAWTLERLRVAEYAIVGALAGYIGGSQVFAFAGARFAVDGAADPMMVRFAVDSVAVRWAVTIVALSALVPETLSRHVRLVLLQVGIALALTAVMAATDPIYAAHRGRVLVQMTFWMTLAATIALFGAARLDELRQQVVEARRMGQYQLLRPIGAGGMGEVHLAEHVLLKHPVAIKLIHPARAGDPEALRRFEREVRATARLTHWNTVQIYDYGFTGDGTFYYAMEYLPGLTLDQIVQRHGPLPAARVIHLLRQVCAALGEAHALHLVHRDIKPANIMVCERGGIHDVAKLLDFGLVRGGGPAAETLVDAHLVVGTPGYMSPEQAQGADPLAPTADLYAVGATAYLLLTGVPAFPPGPAVQVIVAQATQPVRPLREVRPAVPADLEAIVLACLARDPAGRPQSAAALDAALARCADAGTWSQAAAADWWRRHGAPADGARGEVAAAGLTTVIPARTSLVTK